MLIKLLLAAMLAPFGDEAFYWQESRHLAIAYSDLPPLTAWLIGLGEGVFGHGVLAMRAPFLLLGALLPLLVVRVAARLGGPCAGWQAGLWALVLPLAGTLGVLALPDVPLTVAALLALDAFECAARSGRTRHWLLLGLWLGVAGLTHYRVGMLLLAGLAFLLATPRGRDLWSQRGLWLALVIAALGWVPTLVFNIQHDWSAAAFQLVDRHPWSFHADALVQPLEQALVVTPVLYLLLLGALVGVLRRWPRGAPWDLFGTVALVFLGGYFAIGLFADDRHFRVHWPLPGYLALIIVLPILLREWQAAASARSVRAMARVQRSATTLAAFGMAVVLAYFACAAVPGGADRLARYKAFPDNFVGWREAAGYARGLLTEPRFSGATLVADNFLLAAELDFQFDGTRAVPSLDHPLNIKHGRAAQLAIWNRDESALPALAGTPVLLVVEETAGRERDRRAWLTSICSRMSAIEPVGRVDLHRGAKRFAYYAATPRAHMAAAVEPDACVVWREAYAARESLN